MASGAIHFTGSKPCKTIPLNNALTSQLQEIGRSSTHARVLLVVVLLRDVSRESVVSDLHHFILSHQNVTRRQIAVNDLQDGRTCHDIRSSSYTSSDVTGQYLVFREVLHATSDLVSERNEVFLVQFSHWSRL